jgi:hypothetical protein
MALMQKDRLSAVYCGQVNGRYVTVRPGASAAKPLDEAVIELQQALEGRDGALEVAIRRTDRVGHPRVCAWKRAKTQDPWTFGWESGADNLTAAARQL